MLPPNENFEYACALSLSLNELLLIRVKFESVGYFASASVLFYTTVPLCIAFSVQTIRLFHQSL